MAPRNDGQPKRGRKKLPPERQRNNTSLIRFTDREWNDIMDASEEVEKLPAILIRDIAVRAARKLLNGERG
tara:strand:+ start:120 stop:332 length:213 start_codon:yes stop_codon:yes gene_type:complete